MIADSAFWRDMADRFKELPNPSRLAAVLADDVWGVTDGSTSERLIFSALAEKAGIAAGVAGIDGWLDLLRKEPKTRECFESHPNILTMYGPRAEGCHGPRTEGGWIQIHLAAVSAGYCVERETRAFEQEHTAQSRAGAVTEIAASGSTGEPSTVEDIGAALEAGELRRAVDLWIEIDPRRTRAELSRRAGYSPNTKALQRFQRGGFKPGSTAYVNFTRELLAPK